MALRVQVLTFQKDNFKSLIEESYPSIRERILKSANENLDNWDMDTIEMLEGGKDIDNLVALNDEDISIVVRSFFSYLEMGKTKIRHKYYQPFLTLEKHLEDFKLIEESCSNTLQNYFNFIFEGRSLKNEKHNFHQIKSAPNFKVGFLTLEERNVIVEEIENDFERITKGTSIETIVNEFKEIGSKYNQVVILVS